MKKLRPFLALTIFINLFSACDKATPDTDFTEELYNSWEVVEFVSIESVLYAKDNDYHPILELPKNGVLSIRLDINSCFGSFEVRGPDKISFTEIGCTEACCDSDFSMKFIEMLVRVESFKIEDNNMQLHIPDWGFIVLQLQ